LLSYKDYTLKYPPDIQVENSQQCRETQKNICLLKNHRYIFG